MTRDILTSADNPDDILIKILVQFIPEFIVRINTTSKRFYGIANNNYLWSIKGSQHFPRRRTFDINCFKEKYYQSYEDIPKEKRILFSLVKEGDVSELRKIFTLEDFKLKDAYYKTLLELAIFYGHQPILDFFFERVTKAFQEGHIIDLHYYYERGEATLLHWACLCNQPPYVIENIIKDGCNINKKIFSYSSPLSIAARFNYVDLVEILLKNQAECSDSSALYTAVSHGSIDAVKTLYDHLYVTNQNVIDQKMLNSNLYMASQNGHAETVKFFLEKGAEVNSSEFWGITPLMIASDHGHFNTVKCLLDFEANIHAGTDRDDTTALYLAVQENRPKIVNLLLLYGANVNQCRCPTKEKFAPIIMAADVGSIEIIQALIAKGADVNHVCHSGMTPLHYAVKYNRIEAAQQLIKNGANIHAKCRNNTPLDFAREGKHPEMIAMLLPYYRCASFYERSKRSNHVNLSLLSSKKSLVIQGEQAGSELNISSVYLGNQLK